MSIPLWVAIAIGVAWVGGLSYRLLGGPRAIQSPWHSWAFGLWSLVAWLAAFSLTVAFQMIQPLSLTLGLLFLPPLLMLGFMRFVWRHTWREAGFVTGSSYLLAIAIAMIIIWLGNRLIG